MAQIKSNENKPLFTFAVSANIRILVFALSSIALMTLDHRYHHLEALRNALSTLIYPLQYTVQLSAA